MFEKEIEEKTNQYMNEHTENYNCENTKLETDNYNAGLEQGYEDGFNDGIAYGLNKANEWHKVSDKLPEMNVFVYLWTNIDNYPMIACRRKKCDEIDWYWDCQGGYYITRLVSVDEGYLWKEIILPKLKEVD